MTAAPDPAEPQPLPESRSAPAAKVTVTSSATPGPTFPVADVRTTGSRTTAVLRPSRLWWLTAACLLLAVWLTWTSLPPRGPRIEIRFPDGHGLRPGDSLRHRGIEVGSVTAVTLQDDLSAVRVQLDLSPAAAQLAREGTRFWIVRPLLSLTGVSGLETAVGAKYIAVSPGDSDAAACTVFEGLAAVPPDEASQQGVNIVLRGEQRYGIAAAAPVAWRGMEVGRVLGVHLSPDARFVDVHVRIDRSYRRLLRSHSRFWVTSGVGVDVGLSGVRITADSLSTLIRGGVSFATPAQAARAGQTPDGAAVSDGHIFTLHAQPDPDWLNAAATVPLIDVPLPETVTVESTRTTSLLGIRRSSVVTQNGVVVRPAQGPAVLLTASSGLFPVPMAGADAAAAAAPLSLTLRSVVPPATSPDSSAADSSATGILPVTAPADAVQASPAGITRIQLADTAAAVPENPHSELRIPEAVEECCVTRTVSSDGRAESVILSIGRHQLTAAQQVWQVSLPDDDLSPWHGAPVIAMSDGRIIGLFLQNATGPVIAPLTAGLLPAAIPSPAP